MSRYQARILLRELPPHLRDMRFEFTGPALLVPANNIIARDPAFAGVGIALLPRVEAAPCLARGKLVEILKGWTRVGTIHAIFDSSRYLTPKVRAFIDLALANMLNI